MTTADDALTAGVRLWRQRQQLFATVAVKATFTLVPGASMTLHAPLPLEPVERAATQTGGIEPGDLAPYLVQPEIWVRGHAWFPPPQGAPSIRARLVIARDATLIVRKSVEIPIESSAAPFLHALAPLSAKWPVRTRLLGNVPPASLDGSPLELPDVFDWNYFQAAPPDQRCGPLRGDEWIRLEGIHPTMYRFDTRLPSAWSAVALFGPIEPFCRGSAVQVRLDSIQIDADHGWCALVFRGHVALPAHVPTSELQFVAGLGLPDRPMPRLIPRGHDFRPPASTRPTEHLPSFHDTVALDLATLPPLGYDDSSRFPSSIPPSAPPSSRSHHQESAKETVVVDLAALHAATHQGALPFHPSSSAPTMVLTDPALSNEPFNEPLPPSARAQDSQFTAAVRPTPQHDEVAPPVIAQNVQ